MKIRLRNPFAHNKKDEEHRDNENVIEQDTTTGTTVQRAAVELKDPERQLAPEIKRKRFKFSLDVSSKGEKKEQSQKKKEADKEAIKARTGFEKFAYNLLSTRLPGFEEFRDSYAQSGTPVIFESYISTGFLLSCLAAIPALAISLLLEVKLLPRAPFPLLIVGSIVFAGIVFGTGLVLWLSYPIMRRRGYRSKLENQLAYSFGILGVLAAAGMNLERLFERIATSESNPVLADLANRFLRNIRVFGLDTQTALTEVSRHSPSEAFAKMLGSIGVAHKTTGSIHDLVMFESARLLQEKRDKLRKTIGSLAVMAELYITVVVVGPIIFIVMFAIFSVLPGGKHEINPVSFINLIVFIGVPVLSVMFVLLLDSAVAKA